MIKTYKGTTKCLVNDTTMPLQPQQIKIYQTKKLN